MSLFSKIFESGLKANFEEFANTVGGIFIEGGFWDEYRVIVPYRNMVFTLDTVRKLRGKLLVRYYRIQCPFVSINQFKFCISSENAFTHAAKVFGMNDILINDKRFDDEFYLKSNQKETFFHFIDSDNLRKQYWELLKKENYHFSFEIRKHKKHVLCIFTESLYVYGSNLQENIAEWLLYFDTFKITLDRLIEIGEAEDITPEI
jgi:hypothetical protein